MPPLFYFRESVEQADASGAQVQIRNTRFAERVKDRFHDFDGVHRTPKAGDGAP